MEAAKYFIMFGIALVCVCGYLLWAIVQPSPMVKEWQKKNR